MKNPNFFNEIIESEFQSEIDVVDFERENFDLNRTLSLDSTRERPRYVKKE